MEDGRLLRGLNEKREIPGILQMSGIHYLDAKYLTYQPEPRMRRLIRWLLRRPDPVLIAHEARIRRARIRIALDDPKES